MLLQLGYETRLLNDQNVIQVSKNKAKAFFHVLQGLGYQPTNVYTADGRQVRDQTITVTSDLSIYQQKFQTMQKRIAEKLSTQATRQHRTRQYFCNGGKTAENIAGQSATVRGLFGPATGPVQGTKPPTQNVNGTSCKPPFPFGGGAIKKPGNNKMKDDTAGREGSSPLSSPGQLVTSPAKKKNYGGNEMASRTGPNSGPVREPPGHVEVEDSARRCKDKADRDDDDDEEQQLPVDSRETGASYFHKEDGDVGDEESENDTPPEVDAAVALPASKTPALVPSSTTSTTIGVQIIAPQKRKTQDTSVKFAELLQKSCTSSNVKLSVGGEATRVQLHGSCAEAAGGPRSTTLAPSSQLGEEKKKGRSRSSRTNPKKTMLRVVEPHDVDKQQQQGAGAGTRSTKSAPPQTTNDQAARNRSRTTTTPFEGAPRFTVIRKARKGQEDKSGDHCDNGVNDDEFRVCSSMDELFDSTTAASSAARNAVGGRTAGGQGRSSPSSPRAAARFSRRTAEILERTTSSQHSSAGDTTARTNAATTPRFTFRKLALDLQIGSGDASAHHHPGGPSSGDLLLLHSIAEGSDHTSRKVEGGNARFGSTSPLLSPRSQHFASSSPQLTSRSAGGRGCNKIKLMSLALSPSSATRTSSPQQMSSSRPASRKNVGVDSAPELHRDGINYAEINQFYSPGSASPGVGSSNNNCSSPRGRVAFGQFGLLDADGHLREKPRQVRSPRMRMDDHSDNSEMMNFNHALQPEDHLHQPAVPSSTVPQAPVFLTEERQRRVRTLLEQQGEGSWYDRCVSKPVKKVRNRAEQLEFLAQLSQRGRRSDTASTAPSSKEKELGIKNGKDEGGAKPKAASRAGEMNPKNRNPLDQKTVLQQKLKGIKQKLLPVEQLRQDHAEKGGSSTGPPAQEINERKNSKKDKSLEAAEKTPNSGPAAVVDDAVKHKTAAATSSSAHHDTTTAHENELNAADDVVEDSDPPLPSYDAKEQLAAERRQQAAQLATAWNKATGAPAASAAAKEELGDRTTGRDFYKEQRNSTKSYGSSEENPPDGEDVEQQDLHCHPEDEQPQQEDQDGDELKQVFDPIESSVLQNIDRAFDQVAQHSSTMGGPDLRKKLSVRRRQSSVCEAAGVERCCPVVEELLQQDENLLHKDHGAAKTTSATSTSEELEVLYSSVVEPYLWNALGSLLKQATGGGGAGV
ncbi:unnamed protein product [Amoebophrya sp. A120]|nr:unnamed protein product [Amoebophrya sp. A120]|eukprot:GSA120T00000657001.1